MTKSQFYIFILCSVYLCSCKNDPALIEHTDISKTYFEDYVSPEFKWAYIDESENKITKAIYDDARDFSESLAAVNKKGLWGFINRSGKECINCQYKQVTDYSNGRAFAQNFLNQWLLLNLSGEELTILDYDKYRNFKFGYCPVTRQNAWGLIDSSGNEVVACNYSELEIIGNEVFIVKELGKFGILNIGMDTLLPFNYDKIWSPVNGKLKIRKGNLYGYLDEQDYKLISSLYASVSKFQSNNAVVFDGENYLLINRNYDLIKELNFDAVEFAGEDMWKFKENELWGLLNENGDVVLNAQYELINNFTSNRASFQSGGFWGYLDKKGNEIIPPLLGISWDYKNNYVRFIGRGGFGVLDTNGRMIIEDKYKEIRDFHEGRYRIQTFN